MRLRDGGGEGEGERASGQAQCHSRGGKQTGRSWGGGERIKGGGRWRRGREKIMETMDEREREGGVGVVGGSTPPFSFSVRYNSQSLSLSLPSLSS